MGWLAWRSEGLNEFLSEKEKSEIKTMIIPLSNDEADELTQDLVNPNDANNDQNGWSDDSLELSSIESSEDVVLSSSGSADELTQ